MTHFISGFPDTQSRKNNKLLSCCFALVFPTLAVVLEVLRNNDNFSYRCRT